MVRKWRTGRRSRLYVVAFASLLGVLAFGGVSSQALVTACSTANVLSGSNFEIDTNANLAVNGSSPCIDWASVDDLDQDDLPTGSGDDSFGQGTAEDNPNPTIVDGSIPPNKSDLRKFSIFQETTADGKFLELYWARVQNPSGTTNMDFELNQVACDGTAANCANNAPNNKPPVHVTPKRTDGDKLITYDLARGGTVPAISIRTWGGSAWGPADVISDGNSPDALGSVNTTDIAASEIGALTAFTFGEVSIDFDAIFGSNECGTFGSVYLKSRSSDSFTSEIKDFVRPENVFISNCASIVTVATASITIGQSISDKATLSDVAANAGGTITFDLWDNAECSGTPIFTDDVDVDGPGDYTSASFAPTAVGTYYWIASYSGDVSNSPATGACGDAGESSVVNKASPSLGTSPDASSGTVGEVTLNDSATLSNAYNPTGSITFNLYDPTDATCSGTPAFTQTVDLTGSGASTTGGPTADKAGIWRWTASYPGDDNNEAASSGCQAEQVTIAKASPTLPTTPSPSSGDVGDILNDSATVTGGFNPTGTVTFNLYDPDQTGCSGAARFTETITLSGGSATASTTTGFTSDKAGTWQWTASYSGDDNNDPATSDCTSEPVTLDKLPSSIATEQKWYPQDTATIGGGGSGTVDFALYKNSDDCTGTAVYTENDVAVSGTTASTSNTSFFVSAVAALGDTYYWKASYSGDSSHKAVESCVESTAFASLDNGGTVDSP